MSECSNMLKEPPNLQDTDESIFLRTTTVKKYKPKKKHPLKIFMNVDAPISIRNSSEGRRRSRSGSRVKVVSNVLARKERTSRK